MAWVSKSYLAELVGYKQVYGARLEEHHGALVSCSDALAGAKATADQQQRDSEMKLREAHARIAPLARDVAARDLTIRGAAEERGAALEAVGVLATDGDADVLRRVVVQHIVDGLRSGSAAAADQVRSLQSELWLANVSVDADVKALLDAAQESAP
jgi:hypothetical protein